MSIAWNQLRNPLLSYPDYSIKDACVIERDGVYHIFTSAFDQMRSTLVHVTTTDFQNYSDFHFQLDGKEDDWLGMCSPDIAYGNGQYVLVFNSWGEIKGRHNCMFYMESTDLMNWSERKPLGHHLGEDARIIDGAVAWNGERWILCYKWWKQPRMAYADSLDGPWTLVKDERVALLDKTGKENGLIHENFQVIQIRGEWYLVSTDYKPHHAWLYKLKADPLDPMSWQTWEDGYRLDIPQEVFNTVDQDNAAALMDCTETDGYVYLIYAGKNQERVDEFAGRATDHPWARGWNKLALARSQDMIHWTVPGRD